MPGLCQLSTALGVCEIDAVLLSPQAPGLRLRLSEHEHARLGLLQLDCAVRGRFVLPDEVCLLVHVEQTGNKSWCHGQAFGQHSALLVRPRGISDYMLEAGSCLLFMVVHQDKVRSLLAADGTAAAGWDACATHFRIDDQTSPSSLLHLYRALAGMCEATAEDAVAHRQDLLDEVIRTHVQTAMSRHPQNDMPKSSSQYRHYLILQRVEHFMRSHLRKDIYLQEMCQAGGASERTLRNAFEHMVGVSPNRYLAMMRLCMAYRSLARADMSRQSVKSVALSFGLWDLSRFADNYRRIFGELPRATLSGDGA